MTIDYGYEAHLLYHPVRKDGTIMCYKKHKSSENPYINLGEQDIPFSNYRGLRSIHVPHFK